MVVTYQKGKIVCSECGGDNIEESKIEPNIITIYVPTINKLTCKDCGHEKEFEPFDFMEFKNKVNPQYAIELKELKRLLDELDQEG